MVLQISPITTSGAAADIDMGRRRRLGLDLGVGSVVWMRVRDGDDRR